jgi:hypothetical protein
MKLASDLAHYESTTLTLTTELSARQYHTGIPAAKGTAESLAEAALSGRLVAAVDEKLPTTP